MCYSPNPELYKLFCSRANFTLEHKFSGQYNRNSSVKIFLIDFKRTKTLKASLFSHET